MSRTPCVAGILFLLAAGAAAQEGALAEDPELDFVSVQPTVLLAKDRETGALLQAVDVVIENRTGPADVTLEVNIGPRARTIPFGVVAGGRRSSRVFVPDTAEPAAAVFALKAGGKTRAEHKAQWKPQRRWEVCFVPATHHDLGYTDTIAGVLSRYGEIYDSILRFCDETSGYPEESKYRYSVESSWSLQHYLSKRPKETADKVSKYLKEGRIEINAFYGNEITELCGHEELVRLMYPTAKITRELGGEVRFGSITDIPGLAWGIPAILGECGVKYFFAGLPKYFEWKPYDVDRIHNFWDEKNVMRPHGRPEAFLWEAQNGNKLLVWYHGGYGGLHGGRGHINIPLLEGAMAAELWKMQERGAPFRVMRYVHCGADNQLPDVEASRVVREWNRRWAWPKLWVATTTMFFRKLEKSAGDLRTFRGEIPNTDYVVGALCTPKTTAINRITHDRLRAAEIFSTVAHKTVRRGYPADDIRRAYDDMLLYDEHTWGKAYPAGQEQDLAVSEKLHYAYRAAGRTEPLLEGSTRYLAGSVAFKQEAPHVVVFNPLSFERTAVVTLERFRHKGDFELIDEEAGKAVPHQVVTLESPQAPVPYASHRFGRGQWEPHELRDLVFTAQKVPPVGFKTYRLAPRGAAPGGASGVEVGDNALENRFFKVTLDPATGAISGIFDKELGRELVDKEAPFGVNQLVVRRVTTGREEGSGEARIERGARGPVFGSLRVTTKAHGAPQVVQEVRLYRDVKRIDLANRVLKDSTPMVELYFAFPFKMENPKFRYEGANTVVEPTVDQFPGSNTFYYTVQHWADVSDGEVGITLSPYEAHLLEFGGLWPNYCSQAHHGFTPPGFENMPFHAPGAFTKGHMYSFVVASSFRTNFQTVTEGDLLYRYSITAHKGDWKSGVPRDFGWETSNPLLPVLLDGRPQNGLDMRTSFCRIDKPNVVLLALKVAEDRDGLIVRLVETAGEETTVALSLPHLREFDAYSATPVEETKGKLEVRDNVVTVPIRAFSLATVRVRP